MSTESKTPLQEAKEALERAYRVKFDSDPTPQAQKVIEIVALRAAGGETFYWEERENGFHTLASGNPEDSQQVTKAKEIVTDTLEIETEHEIQVRELKPESVEIKVNGRQAQFCRYVATGMPAGRAYQMAGYSPKNNDNADICASMLLKKDYVARYLRSLKESTYIVDVLTLAEKRKGLADAWRTPVGEIDETSPLAQEVTYKDQLDKEGNVVYREKKVKMVGKIEAMKLDAQLAGELKDDKGSNANITLNLLAERLELPTSEPVTYLEAESNMIKENQFSDV